MQRGNLVRVVLATNDTYARGTAVALRSAEQSLARNAVLEATILHSGLDAGVKDDLARVVRSPHSTTFVQLDSALVRGLRTGRFINATTYARLFIGDFLPQEAQRCIYLDSDIIVEADIAELHGVPLNGAAIGAVGDHDDTHAAKHMRRLGCTSVDYFNAGVLVIDLIAWRRDQLGKRAIDFCRSAQPDYFDQDGLNHVLDGRWQKLDPKWNRWASHAHEYSGQLIHFAWVPKPWDADYSGRFADRWFAHLDQTPFAGWRPSNPLGLGPALKRLKRKIPHLPAVPHVLRQRWRDLRQR